MSWWAWILVGLYVLVGFPAVVAFCKAADTRGRTFVRVHDVRRGPVAPVRVKAYRDPRP